MNQMHKNKRLKPKKSLKEAAIIFLVVVCLSVGFLAGYISKKIPLVPTSNEGLVDEAYDIIEKYWVDASGKNEAIEASTIQGLISGLKDPHTSYFTSEEAQAFNETVSGSYQGIGVGYSMVENGGMITKVYDHSPASEVELKVGDIILKADDHSLAGVDTNTVKEYVRGKQGTPVILTIQRGTETFEKTLIRRALDTSAFYEIRTAGQNRFGYIELSTFGNDTAKQVEEALELFTKEGVTTLVLDLRDNGGGYLTAAQDILDLFFTKDEVIYQMQEKDNAPQKFYAATDTQYSFDQGYILVNGETASASELTAGALQSEKGFKLIGETTYGKGSAQTQKVLSDGSVLKFTYAKWMIPNGTCIHDKGLTPDIEVSNVSLANISTESVKEDLKYDQVDFRVASMQKMLSILGYQVDREDGYFSKTTELQLKKFEKDNHLNDDGIYQERDKLMLVAKMMIYIQQHENDTQYEKLLEIVRK